MFIFFNSFEEEKINNFNQIKIKKKEKGHRDSGLKHHFAKEQDYFNNFYSTSHNFERNYENPKIYFKDMQGLKEEKESGKMKFQNSGN